MIKFKKIIILIFIIFILITVILKLKNTKETMNQLNEQYIVIDPGHGGIDGGGMSNTGMYEKDINLKISYYLKCYLENSGYTVLLTRYSDYDLASKNSSNRKKEDISKRLDIINNDDVFLYISIHCNIYTNNSIYGAQTFYNDNDINNKLLAENVQKMLINILKNTTRKAKSIEDKYLIENAKKVGCLVEVGFLSNEQEFNLLKTNQYQDLVAYCIYLGIIEYLSRNN